MPKSAHELADAFGDAMKRSDADAIRTLYADSITIWHGATGGTMGKDENVGLLSGVFAVTSRFEYTGIKRYDIPGGVVQQHTVQGAFTDGTPLPPLNACMVIKVADDQITSIEEYFDSQTYAEVWARMAALAPAPT